MQYISTRGNHHPVTSSEAIKTGMVPAGGLFVPENLPQINKEFLTAISQMDYNTLSTEVLRLYLTDYSVAELNECISAAYNDTNFDQPEIAPLVQVDETYILELWHGPTAAFKDMALQIMPRLLVKAMQKTETQKEVVILVATSGDTGKAALEGFKNVQGTKIICFFPYQAVSKVQELQMTTTDGDNTFVVAVEGNFDDCQTAVKNIFGDQNFVKLAYDNGFELSSANSINWGRLVPQIIYYFWSYAQLVNKKAIEVGDKINIVVPTGNFGNILAGYYALQMGLPVNRFICASNTNNVLTDFLNTGVYDRRRNFYQTSSPSMDILISSNLERFLFEITGHDGEAVSKWLSELNTEGVYTIDAGTQAKISDIMEGGFADEDEITAIIASVFNKTGYVLDPHTAVGYHVYMEYRNRTKDYTPTILTATANPYKFNSSVLTALKPNSNISDEFDMVKVLHDISGLPVHNAVQDLDKKTVLHNKVIKTDELPSVVKDILNF